MVIIHLQPNRHAFYRNNLCKNAMILHNFGSGSIFMIILSSKLSPHGGQNWQSSSFERHIPSSYTGLVPILRLGGVRLRFTETLPDVPHHNIIMYHYIIIMYHIIIIRYHHIIMYRITTFKLVNILSCIPVTGRYNARNKLIRRSRCQIRFS